MSKHSFTERALTLVSNGYRVIPIKPGGKAPAAGEGWQKLHATEAQVRKWGANGLANANIGIITETTPAIDIDIYDADVADRMEQWVLDNIPGASDAPRRVGRAPKRLLMFRADEPFRKQQAEYKDPSGQKHKLEVLGAGQQFVAYGIHPDTHKPFEWTTFDQPLDIAADELPVLLPDDARRAVAEFERICKEIGWTRVSGSSHSAIVVSGRADDNALLSYKKPLETKTEDIREALEYLSPDDGYDRWREVGMALHHQYGGSEEGLELWDAWSQASTAYDRNEIEEKWPSFSETPDGRSPVTVATLFKYANDAKSKEQEEEFERVLNVIRTTTDQSELFKSVAKEVASVITAEYQFDIAAKKIQERAKELTGVNPRIDTVRKTLQNARQKRGDSSRTSMPEWCEQWVYLENGDRFYNIETKQELTERGFNAKFDREVLSDEDRALGVATPDAQAAKKALNVYNIPTVYSTVYLPGYPRIIEVSGQLRANTYNEMSIPESKLPETPDEHEAIRLVERHFRMTFPDERERELVLDYLCYNVQFTSEKIAWGVLIVGAEGVGKTWFLKFMQMMLGPQNVAPLAASALQENFNGWAEGTKMRFIEEIRLHGQNRYEIIEKLKEPVGNEDIEIRRMNRDRYVIPNVTNYIAFSNYWDAMPIKKNNRRYLVVGTQLQTDDEVERFNEKYPNYFAELFEAVYAHAAVLRGWMMSRRISAYFEPKKPAPDTAARRKMADTADVSDEHDTLIELIEKSTRPDVSNALLTVDALREEADNAGVQVPAGRTLNTLLMKTGFHSLGRLTVDGSVMRCYTREPNLYPDDDAGKTARVRDVLNGNALPGPIDPLAFEHDEEVDPWA